jgi:hypothetical protein
MSSSSSFLFFPTQHIPFTLHIYTNTHTCLTQARRSRMSTESVSTDKAADILQASGGGGGGGDVSQNMATMKQVDADFIKMIKSFEDEEKNKN